MRIERFLLLIDRVGIFEGREKELMELAGVRL